MKRYIGKMRIISDYKLNLKGYIAGEKYCKTLFECLCRNHIHNFSKYKPNKTLKSTFYVTTYGEKIRTIWKYKLNLKWYIASKKHCKILLKKKIVQSALAFEENLFHGKGCLLLCPDKDWGWDYTQCHFLSIGCGKDLENCFFVSLWLAAGSRCQSQSI